MPRSAGGDRIDSYLLCATPRSGSSLLCGMLDSTGVAGHPESYFRPPSEEMYADQWQLARSADGSFRYHDYAAAAMAEGRTENGVFAARIMGGSLHVMIAKLRAARPGITGGDRDLLRQWFGRTRYVYLRRGDVLAQAVSLLRAEQTGVWHEDEIREGGGAPRFDPREIRRLIQMLDEDNAAWQAWFAAQDIQPHPVWYEELAADPVGVARRVLEFLGLNLPAGRAIVARHQRLADELNAEWIDRYSGITGNQGCGCG